MSDILEDEITRLRTDNYILTTLANELLYRAKAAEAEMDTITADRDKMREALDEFLIEYDNEVARTPSNHSTLTMTFARQNDLISMMRAALALKEQPDAD